MMRQEAEAMSLKEEIGHWIARDLPRRGTMGFGSGSTVNAIISVLGNDFSEIKWIAGSRATSDQLSDHGLKETEPAHMSVCIDGADQLLKEGILLKGGGGALFREKVLWGLAETVIVGITYDKVVSSLTHPLAIEIDPFAEGLVRQSILDRYSCDLALRGGENPFMTDNGNWILDCSNLLQTMTAEEIVELHHWLKSLTGVIETGIFVEQRGRCKVIVASENGIEELRM
jgi:ribose 5-phosphate isomerase A